MIKAVMDAMYARYWGKCGDLISRNMHIHECTVTSDSRRNRGQHRSNFSSSVNEMAHVRVDGVYSLKLGCLTMS